MSEQIRKYVRRTIRELGIEGAEKELRELANRPIGNWTSSMLRYYRDKPALECFESGEWEEY